jgi:hypothetical protein
VRTEIEMLTISEMSPVEAQVQDSGWQALAACQGADLSLFFAPNYFEVGPAKGNREAKAKLICRSCPVRTDCLSYALDTGEEHGVWGGLNERERRRLLVRIAASVETRESVAAVAG